MGRMPEAGDGRIEDEVPLYMPGHVLHDVSRRDRSEQPSECTSGSQDMRIGYLMESHEDRSEDAVQSD